MTYIKVKSNLELPLDTQLILVYDRICLNSVIKREHHVGICKLCNGGKSRLVIAGGRFDHDLGELIAYKPLELFDGEVV